MRAREQARIDHAAQVEAVRRANAEIAPRVMQAKLAEEELRRVRVRRGGEGDRGEWVQGQVKMAEDELRRIRVGDKRVVKGDE